MAVKILTPANLGRGFDVGTQVAGKVEVAGPWPAPLNPAPQIRYVSGAGSAASLVNSTATVVQATPWALYYKLTAQWTLATQDAMTRLRVVNVSAANILTITWGAMRLDLLAPTEVGMWDGTDFVLRNVPGGSAAQPMRITVFMSVKG